jgi:hypothetical protein
MPSARWACAESVANMMAAAALTMLAPDRILLVEVNEVFISAFLLLSICFRRHRMRPKRSLCTGGEFVAVELMKNICAWSIMRLY